MTRRSSAWWLLFVVNALLASIWLTRWHSSGTAATPGYHDMVDERTLGLFRTVVPSWKHLLVALSDDAHRDHARLAYLELLARRYASLGLHVVPVVGDSEARRILSRTTRLRAVVDPALFGASPLSFTPRRARARFLQVDASGRIEFWSALIPPEDELRQIAEKCALERIDYAATARHVPAHFRPGADLSRLALARAVTAAPLPDWTSAGAVTLFVSSARDACGLSQLLETAASFRTGENLANPLWLLFENLVDQGLLERFYLDGRLPEHMVSPAADSDVYSTRITDGDRPLVVQSDSSGRVVASGVM